MGVRMSFDKDKLKAFENAILDETDKKISQIEDEIKEYEEAEMKKAKDDDYNRMFSYMQEQVQEIKNKYRKDITKYELQTKRSIFLYRNSLADKVFDEVCEKLVEFSNSDKYLDFMILKINEALKVFPCNEGKILVSEKDLALSDKIMKEIPAIKDIACDKKNTFGGFILMNEEAGLLIDQTFKTLIEDEKQNFYSSCGMMVNL